MGETAPLESPPIDVSVVVPVYGCAGCLAALHARLTAVLAKRVASYELVFVDDRSRDGAWPILLELAASDDRVVALRLSRNFGQHPAITAGIARSRGRTVVVMDCDLQDPPEEVPRLLAVAEQGYDIVFARRAARTDRWARRIGSALYFRALSTFTGAELDGAHGTFSAITRKVADAFLELQDADRHYLFILKWLGFESTSIDVAQGERYAGKSSYSLSRLVAHAVDGLVFQTTKLLRWIIYAGFGVAGLGVLLAAFFVYSWAVNTPYPGWTSLAVLVLILGGFILLSLGVTGLYVGKIFGQVKQRPLFVVDEEIGGAAAGDRRVASNEPAGAR
jgi:dolichol-phosphate mannosyltransferase